MATRRKPGPKPKSAAQHKREGTYRQDRHGPPAKTILDYPPKPDGVVSASAKSQRRWIDGRQNAAQLERAVARGARFNERLAEHAAEFFPRFLCHSKDKWYGEPFELLDWQRDDLIYPLFGWVRPDGRRLMRRAYIEIPKKNGKSTLASGIGLYMLTADGAGGAEVYSVAADRDQATIVHREAVNMVDASPKLAEVCKVNRSTHNIYYHGTKSLYRALSAAPGGKEGLNAHCCILDELHIWRGRALWDTLRYAYRSRSEPVQFVITTAGDDPESICWDQHAYAEQVRDGRIDDDSLLPLFWRAEPGDDWKDEGVWEEANPSYRVTVPPESLREDFREAEQSAAAASVFRRYTLNIWSTGRTAWLDQDRWQACAREFDEDDLAGEECWLGLDMSQTRDMTAVTAVFPQPGGEYKVWSWFWLPSGSRKYYSKIVGFEEWVEGGWLNLIPGDVIEPSVIEEAVLGLFDRYKVLGFTYDPMFCEDLSQRIEQQTRIPRVAFKQRITSYAAPTAEWERLVIAEKLHHPSHPILNWQAGNVEVYSDVQANMRPVKPKSGEHKRIDGIVAGIMALGQTMHEPATSVYNQPGRELSFA